jgi:hypothetical protein
MLGLLTLPVGLTLRVADRGLTLTLTFNLPLRFLQGAAAFFGRALQLPAGLGGDGLRCPSGGAANVLECLLRGLLWSGGGTDQASSLKSATLELTYSPLSARTVTAGYLRGVTGCCCAWGSGVGALRRTHRGRAG